ncbi:MULTISPECIES: YdbH domain-containing protein [unclassified Neptuniibacter]|uniref:YdbH domain-containing protein n=1 Tax=unclassified Neptuniibacter TaxID=2630693 RepID=UPI0025F53258|nr:MULTISPECIES: YdbH domain-containing protein [unclassified Neptuniibacter]|tara:strand:- start:6170 stop:8545 length:2376 start_codon:yes stop_codon:yes gene_type:complete
MQKRTKLYRWLVSLSLFSLLVFPLCLYLLSPIIAQKSLEHWLLQQGFSDVTFAIQHPRWNRLHVDKLELTKRSPDEELHVIANNAQIHFNPVTLYLQQQIKSITLPSTSLSITYLTNRDTRNKDHNLDLQSLLPEQWFEKIPTDTVDLQQFELFVKGPTTTNDWAFNGNLSFDKETLQTQINAKLNTQSMGTVELTLNKQNRINFRLLENESPLFTLKGTFIPYPDKIEFDSQQTLDITQLRLWYEALQPNIDALLGNEETLTNTLPNINGALQSQGLTSLPLEFTPAAFIGHVQTTQQFKNTLLITSPVPEVGMAKISTEGTLRYKGQELSVSISPESKLSAHDVKPERHSKPIKEINLALQDEINLSINLAQSMLDKKLSLQLDPFDFTLHSTDITLPRLQIKQIKLGISLTNINLGSTLDALTLNGTIEAPSVNLKFDKKQQPILKLKNHFSLNKQRLTHQFNLSTKNLPIEVKGQVSTYLLSKNTRFNWSTKPIKLSTIDKQMSNFIPIPPQLSLLSGSLFHNAQGEWKHGKLTLQANNSIRQGSVSWEESLVEQIEFDSKTRLYASGKIVDTGKIKLGKVTTGIKINNIDSNYTFTQQSKRSLVKLKTLQAELLGGQVKVKDVQFDLLNPEVKTQIDIERLDLAAILELEQQEGLSGEGRLSGNLPMHYKNGELTINDGYLNSLSPGGKIVFTPTQSVAAYAATNIGLKTAIEALGNFHYQQLDIKLDYLTDGTALLKTRLKGNNPDWNKGHPIDFTINIEENVLQLLKTLQFTDKLTKTVEKRYR